MFEVSLISISVKPDLLCRTQVPISSLYLLGFCSRVMEPILSLFPGVWLVLLLNT